MSEVLDALFEKSEDRTVHAAMPDGRTQVVRYDRAGRWYIETFGDVSRSRTELTLEQAVERARLIDHNGGEVFFGRPGGLAFDRALRRRRGQ